jgi:hypothetical protein
MYYYKLQDTAINEYYHEAQRRNAALLAQIS